MTQYVMSRSRTFAHYRITATTKNSWHVKNSKSTLDNDLSSHILLTHTIGSLQLLTGSWGGGVDPTVIFNSSIYAGNKVNQLAGFGKTLLLSNSVMLKRN